MLSFAQYTTWVCLVRDVFRWGKLFNRSWMGLVGTISWENHPTFANWANKTAWNSLWLLLVRHGTLLWMFDLFFSLWDSSKPHPRQQSLFCKGTTVRTEVQKPDYFEQSVSLDPWWGIITPVHVLQWLSNRRIGILCYMYFGPKLTAPKLPEPTPIGHHFELWWRFHIFRSFCCDEVLLWWGLIWFGSKGVSERCYSAQANRVVHVAVSGSGIDCFPKDSFYDKDTMEMRCRLRIGNC